jgi:hypothetical protein
MPAEPQHNRLPFEPSKKRQKPEKNTTKKSGKQAPVSKKSENKLPETAKTSESKAPLTKAEMAVPKVVSDRMARRMALFCGVPTALGMVTFVASYLVISHGWLKVPNVAVVLVSMGFFGLGVLGLSYGVLSASWDEEILGSKLGWQEFKTNWGRMTSAWRSTKQKNV